MFVNIVYIIFLFAVAFGVTNIVNIKAQRFCKIIESIKFEFIFQNFIPPTQAKKNSVIAENLFYIRSNSHNGEHKFQTVVETRGIEPLTS